MVAHSTTRGRIVLVPFPFDDLSAVKARPAVCLTDPIGPHRHIVLAFITSRVPSDLLPSDLVLAASDPGFASTGLRMTSTIRLHRLMIVRAAFIRRQLGVLPPTLQREVQVRLQALVGPIPP